jgi:hypothetical protein
MGGTIRLSEKRNKKTRSEEINVPVAMTCLWTFAEKNSDRGI